MGSAKTNKPQTMENKPSKFLSILKSLVNTKKKEKIKNDTVIEKDEPKMVTENPVAAVMDTFKKLNLKDSKNNDKNYIKDRNNEKRDVKDGNNDIKDINNDIKDINNDKQEIKIEKNNEFDNFNFKTINEEHRNGRIDSNSSEDSGFSEKDADIIESISKLKIDDKKEKKKQTVFISRAPIRNKVTSYQAQPYDAEARQIHQINQIALSGGQVIVNTTDTYSEIDTALKNIESLSQSSQNEQDYWQDVLELIKEDIHKENIIKELEKLEKNYENSNLYDNSKVYENSNLYDNSKVSEISNSYENSNSYESSTYTQNYSEIPPINYENDITNSLIDSMSIFPTPPRSENVGSPMSDQVFYQHTPEMSPTYSDLEKYQDLTHLEDLIEEKEEKPRGSVSSNSSMTLKNFKDLQKELVNGYAKSECCAIKRKSCKELFDEHMKSLEITERKNLCFSVAKMDLRMAYGVLQNILINLSPGSEQDHLQCSLFALICQRVLAENPALYIGNFGLNVLTSAVLRCPRMPYLTRCVVDCIHAAMRADSKLYEGKETIFHEVDKLGDNLIIACARAGDLYADTLAEITRNSAQLPPLFKVNHVNSDGHTALHVACNLHSVKSPRLHTVHVLSEHSGADLWKGDIRGGDTPLHLAVNSANCDLHLVLMIFKQVDRKLWKKLAHYQNLSSVTPLEYARSAARSTTRQNYPQEVLSFLMKCR